MRAKWRYMRERWRCVRERWRYVRLGVVTVEARNKGIQYSFEASKKPTKFRRE